MGVYPINDLETVDKIGKRLGIDLDTVFTLNNVDGQSHPHMHLSSDGLVSREAVVSFLFFFSLFFF